METLSPRNSDTTRRQYVPASAELDDLPEPDEANAEVAAQPVGQQHISLYTWWQKKGEHPTPFVVVEKETKWIYGKPVTVAIWILLVGDSNRHRRPIDAILKAIADQTIEPITYR